VQALGPVVDEPEVARDPRIVIGSGFPTARMLFDGDRIGAIVVTSGAISPTRPPGASVPPCTRPPSTDKSFGSCLTGAGELVEVVGDDVTVRTPGTERTIASLTIPNLVFAAPLRNPTEGRDELIAVTRTDEPTVRTWSVVGYRFEGMKIVRAVDPTPAYVLTTTTARWIGAELREVELYLELTSRPDSVEVGGLLTTRAGAQGAWRDVVVISPASVARRRGKSAGAEGSDAGAGDAGGEASESGSGAGRSKP